MLAPSHYYNNNNNNNHDDDERRHLFVQYQRPSATQLIRRNNEDWNCGNQFSVTQRSLFFEQRTAAHGNGLYETKPVENQYGTTYSGSRGVEYLDEISMDRKWRVNPFSSNNKMALDDAQSFRSFSPTSMTSDGINLTSPTDEWQFGDVTGCSEAIARRNERERNRVRTINQTFSRLRQHLPASITWAAAAAASAAAESAANDRPSTTTRQKKLAGAGVRRPSSVLSSAVPGVKSKKLSKVQILRAAIDYIALLRQTLEMASDKSSTAAASLGVVAEAVRGDVAAVVSSRFNHRRVSSHQTDAELRESEMKARLSDSEDVESVRDSCISGDDVEEALITPNPSSAIGSLTHRESWNVSPASDSECKHLDEARLSDETPHFRAASFRSANDKLFPSTTYPFKYSHVKVETSDNNDCDIYAAYAGI